MYRSRGATFPTGDGGTIHHEGIIEAYYLCGETEKANQILSEYYRNLRDEWNYYTSLKPRHQSSIQQEISETMYQMEELKSLLEHFQQTDLMLELGISDFGS